MANHPSKSKSESPLLSLPSLAEPTKRYERKFFIERVHRTSIEALVKAHSRMFREVYYRRQVNNIYFDTYDLRNFWDNVAGSQNRTKIRIRWYGDMFGEITAPTLEVKIKSGFVGWKASYPLPSFAVAANTDLSSLQKALAEAELPASLRITLETLHPTLINTYWRRYFVSADGAFRLTVDDEMEYRRPAKLSFVFAETQRDLTSTIVELKYAEISDSVADSVAGEFPYRITKSSKYVTGLETLGVAES